MSSDYHFTTEPAFARMTALRPEIRRQMAGRSFGYGETPPPPDLDKYEPNEITAWECARCSDVHTDEQDARECCMPEHPKSIDRHDQDGWGPACPVCGSECADHHAAASCCMWKDLQPLERFSIAVAVEAGADWPDAISSVTSAREAI